MTQSARTSSLQGFGIANYRGFGKDGFVVGNLSKINIFIGKNNCGKSNVLRAISLLRQVNSATPSFKTFVPLLDNHRRSSEAPVAIARVRLDDLLACAKDPVESHVRKQLAETVREEMEIRFNTQTGAILEPHPLAHAHMNQLDYLMRAITRRHFDQQAPRDNYYRELNSVIIGVTARAFLGAFDKLLMVPVFREVGDVNPQPADDKLEVFDGSTVVETLRRIKEPKMGNEHELEVYQKILRFVRRLLGVPDLTLAIPPDEKHILVGMHGNRLPLSSYGTGVHHLVILCSALALHSDYAVTIEEPEVHLHPHLQRKFFQFIAEETDNTYYITTHSNVFLDARPDTSVYHVEFDGRQTKVTHLDTTARAREVLTDMGYKASDLLQANGIVWVEGPTDRIYLKRWLQLAAPTSWKELTSPSRFTAGNSCRT
jgi:putative ATP-dependent endonuclease of OLD family